MADKKISDLSELLVIDDSDFFVFVDQSADTTYRTTFAAIGSNITIAASQVSDFDTEVSNNADVAANTSARHDAATVADSSTINFTLTGQEISGSTIDSAIDHDALLNFVANEHIDWTNASAGTIHASNYVDNDTTDHTALSNIGTNTHAQIDSHISSTLNPHSVTYTQVGADAAGTASGLIGTHESTYTHSDIAANTSARHDAATVADSSTINFSITGQEISGSTIDSAIDHDALLNFVANEHIDWTNAASNLLTTGTGTFDQLTTDQVQFRTGLSAPAHSEGLVFWDDDDKALSFHTDISGTTLQIGQEQLVKVLNKTGSTLTDGQVVYIDGAQGSRPTVALADADIELQAHKVLGVITTDILNNDEGYINVQGIVRDFDTSGYTEGDILYLSQTAGEITNVAPDSPAHTTIIGFALNSTVNGSILISIQQGKDISGLDDVDITSIADNDILQYNSTSSIWKNITQSTFNSALDHDALLNFVANEHIDWTNATSNFLTTGMATIGADLAVDTDTLFVDSAANRVGIGTPSPSRQFHCIGNSQFDDVAYFSQGAADTPSIRFGAQSDGIAVSAPNTFMDFILAGVTRLRFGTGTMRFAGSGSAGSPAFSWLDAANAGMYRDSTGVNYPVAISHAGNKIAEFGYYRNTSLYGRSAAYPCLKVLSHASQTASIQEWQTSAGVALSYITSLGGMVLSDDLTVDTDTFFVDASSNRVGIGTTSPQTKLHIKDSANPTLRLQDSDSDSYTEIYDIGDTSGGIKYTQPTGFAVFDIDPIASDGTSSAYFRYFRNTNTTGSKYLQFLKGDNSATVHAQIGVDGLASYFQIGGGNFGIGIAIPTEKLHVVGRVIEEGTFGEIHLHDGSTAQSIATGATYTKLTAFDNDGESANMTTAVASDKITITKTGRYLVTGTFSYTSGTANVTWKCAPFLNGVEQDQIHWRQKSTTTTDMRSASFSGIIDVTTASWDLDVRLAHDNGSDTNITMNYCNLSVIYLGET